MNAILHVAIACVLEVAGFCQAETARQLQTYLGMCDASAAVAINEDLFIVGDDEDSILRVYSRSRGGMALQRLDVAPFLGFTRGEEADIEGAARIGNRIFWITSHGNNRKGREQQSRHRLFAVKISKGMQGVEIEPEGRPYQRLLDRLLAAAQLKEFDLRRAHGLPPKTPGALNIEGLAATPDDHLLIGFRNPVPRGKALLVPLLNPVAVLIGEHPTLGKPVLLNLGGRGIRSIERWGAGYIIVGGGIGEGGRSALYYWDGVNTTPEILRSPEFHGLTPEAITIIEGTRGTELLALSDDGTRKIDGKPCKHLVDPARKQFRAVSVPLNLEFPQHQTLPWKH